MGTNCLFQLPFHSLVRKMMPRKVSSRAMAVHTPFRPYSFDSHQAIVRRKPHIDNRLMMAGFSVSPAPMKTPLHTMAAANIGSANASMRKTWSPVR